MANERQRLTDQAERAARRGDLAAAVECYRQLLAITPDDLNLLQKQGDALARLGRDDDARDAFLQLARACEATGHTSRSLAALRRASRLGEPRPELLQELGFRAVEAGLRADAVEPLLKALEAFAEAGDAASARSLAERACALLPRELPLFEARVRMEAKLGGPEERSRASIDLALCHARLGRPENSLSALADALRHDPVSPLVRQLDAICVALGALSAAQIPEALPGLSTSEAEASWSIVRSALLLRAGEREAAVRVLRARLAVAGGPGPWLSAVLGRLLLEAGDIEAGDHAARFAVRGLSKEPKAHGALVELLNLLVSRDPGREWAISCLVRLDERKSGAIPAAAARTTGEAGPKEPKGQPSEASAKEGLQIESPEAEELETGSAARDDLPDEIRARLFEAESLIDHGFGDTAARALQKIPAQFMRHAEVRRLLAKCGGEDEGVVENSYEGDQGAPPAGRETAEIPIPMADSQSPMTAAPGGPGETDPELGGPDLGVLDEQIQALVPEADAETSYQMGIGFVEMGLVDQAVPLLEKALGHPSRAVDAGLVAVRLLRESGAADRAWTLGTRAFRVAQSVEDTARVELLAVLADTCFDLGRPSEAGVLVQKLETLDGAHPALVDLKRRLKASIS